MCLYVHSCEYCVHVCWKEEDIHYSYYLDKRNEIKSIPLKCNTLWEDPAVDEKRFCFIFAMPSLWPEDKSEGIYVLHLGGISASLTHSSKIENRELMGGSLHYVKKTRYHIE